MPKYKISDLSKGMKVYKEQLSEILDTWIILYRPKDSDMKEDGIIGYIGNEPNAESDALYSSDNIITPVYNDSIELEEDIFYDEWYFPFGNTLIGVDILKKLDIFIGKNKEGETILIATPTQQKSKSFVAVLSELIDVKKL